MHWADRITGKIIGSQKHKPYHINDMWTPSGFAHIGSLRGPLLHDLVFKALKDAGVKATYTFVFNDFDPIDSLPPSLEKKFKEYLGFPLRKAPSPEKGFDNFAEFFSQNFSQIFKKLGVESTFLSSWDMYQQGKFNDVMREALDNADKIQDIYQRVSGSRRKKGWLPIQIICEKCGRLGTTLASDWDGENVSYRCEPNLVSWAKGCGHSGSVSPFDGRAKLLWRVDWPAHWKVLGVTVEGSGKDHSAAGGSRDVAREISKEVFGYPEPFDLPYEFFVIAGKKMASSKGVGTSAKDLVNALPPAVLRFLFARTNYRQAIEFKSEDTTAIPDLFDEYDKAWRAYVSNSDEDLSRSFVLAQIGKVPGRKKTLLPRFRDIVNYLQFPDVHLQKKFEEIKGGRLTFEEAKLLKEREKYAQIWLGNYAPREFQMQMVETLPREVDSLNKKQKQFLKAAIYLLKEEKSPDELQLALYNTAKELGIESREAFSSIYVALIGKDHGPRAAWFLLQYPKDKVLKRLKEASG